MTTPSSKVDYKKIFLEPCPFCGFDKPKLTEKRRGNYSREGDNYQGLCGKCKARGPIVQDDPQKAADEWNKRSNKESVSQDWRNTLIETLVVCHIYKKEHDDNPAKAIHDLICFENEVALDPAVSNDAIKLVDEWFKRLSKIELGVGLSVFYDEEHGFYFEFEDGPGIYESSQDYYPSAIEAIKAAEKLSNSGEW